MRYIPHGDTPSISEMSEARARDYARTILSGAEQKDVSSHEGALALPYISPDEDIAKAHEACVGIAHLVVVGIGGSSLGTRAVYDALRPNGIELTILDALSPAHITRLVSRLAQTRVSPQNVGICLISKSGGTTETLGNYAALIGAMRDRMGSDETPRTLVITDPGSKLDTVATEAGFVSFHIPPAIGGRYSVFTNVGIIPLSILGVDISSLCTGARELLAGEGVVDSALRSAQTIAHISSRGVIDTFLFDPELHSYGNWRRQLLGESLGKSVALDGTSALYGPLPTVSTVGDLHSIAQLYLAGPRGIHTDFVTADGYDDMRFSEVLPLSILPHLQHKGARDVTHALEMSVLASYTDRALPYAEYRIASRSASELGALMAFNMLETMLAASMMGIDAFDQPNVELYKTKMHTSLQGS